MFYVQLNDHWRKKHTTNLGTILKKTIHQTVQNISKINTNHNAVRSGRQVQEALQV